MTVLRYWSFAISFEFTMSLYQLMNTYTNTLRQREVTYPVVHLKLMQSVKVLEAQTLGGPQFFVWGLFVFRVHCRQGCLQALTQLLRQAFVGGQGHLQFTGELGKGRNLLSELGQCLQSGQHHLLNPIDYLSRDQVRRLEEHAAANTASVQSSVCIINAAVLDEAVVGLRAALQDENLDNTLEG